MRERPRSDPARYPPAEQAQAVLDLPGVVADRGVHTRPKPPRRARKPLQGVSERAKASATTGLLRRGWQHSSRTSRKGIHVIRHILPYWSDGVRELAAMIELWTSAGPSLPFDSEKA